MPEYAPLFSPTNVLPKNTTPLTDRLTTNELIDETVGAAAGATATVTRARVPANAGGNSGKVTAETQTLIDRATTAADITAIENKFRKKKPSFAFPRDLSGNGGPAFTRA